MLASKRVKNTMQVIRLLIPSVLLFLVACSSNARWSMMPTPTVHQYLGGEVFDSMSDEKKITAIEIFYATNRPASGSIDDRTYNNGLAEKLHLGKVSVRLGDRLMSWENLRDLSILSDRKVKIPLYLDNVTEIAEIHEHKAIELARAINQTLSKREDKQLTIYVHGAKSSFFKSCVQGAQFHHFSRREGVLLSFAWPSTGSFLGYKKDVEYAAQSVESFADLIEFLAANTDAEKINILAYSAGAQIIAPSLALLRERYPDEPEDVLRQKFRIGVAYFAAPDVSLKKFVNTYLPAFHKIVDNTTVTYHREDGVLAWAAVANKEIRLGRPDDGELDEQEIAFLEQASQQGLLDAIDMQYSPAKRLLNFRSHGHWYSNEWVSSDVLLQFLYHARPDERGLQRQPDSLSWYFPPDYPDGLRMMLKKLEKEPRQ